MQALVNNRVQNDCNPLHTAMHPKPRFEELAFHETPLGELSLRRRTILSLENREVYEIILGDAFLMSSLFTEVEQALARLGLAAAADGGQRRLDGAHRSGPEAEGELAAQQVFLPVTEKLRR